jgi:flagellar motility protein MotE (MotC chaperone)
LILALALFSLFDYDVKGQLLKVGNQIPFLNTYLPDPIELTAEGIPVSEQKVDAFGVDYTKEIRALNDKIALQESELKKAVQDVQTKDQLITELKDTVKTQEEQLKAKALSDEEYTKKIKELADVYGNMSASKAAPIMENLSTEEAVLVLNEMSADAKKNILQKMNPQRAAEISILSKDVVPTKDREIAALQARLNIQNPNLTAKSKVSKSEMASTYTSMDPQVAAAILSELIVQNPTRVYSILSNMDSDARSQILSEMPADLAAEITNKIGE